MKKRIMYVVLFVFTLSTVYAADVGIGIATWYAGWKMKSKSYEWDIDPVLFIGPTAFYQFADEWSISLIALVTANKYEQEISGSDTIKYRRYDADLTLNYLINSYIKCFAGIKYLAFDYTTDTMEAFNQGAGPGAGIGLTVPLSANFYLLGLVSGIYGYGRETFNNTYPWYPNNVNFYSYGANSTLQISYLVQTINAILTIGYRYQYIKVHYLDDIPNSPKDWDNHFKGFTASVVKAF